MEAMADVGAHEGAEPDIADRVPIHLRVRSVLVGRGAVVPLAGAQEHLVLQHR